MYKYDAIDRQLIDERVAQFRDQVRRWKAGELTDDEFRPLRLQNGLYIQRHAPMFRIAVPYGMLSSAQLRRWLTSPARYDRGVGHFTTRQNCSSTGRRSRTCRKFWPNWPKSRDARHPDLRQLRYPQHHHRPVRRRRADDDHRPAPAGARSCASGPPSTRNSPSCRASSRSPFGGTPGRPRRHLVPRHRPAPEAGDDGEVGFTVIVGGGLGRTPIGQVVRDFLPWQDILLLRSHPARL